MNTLTRPSISRLALAAGLLVSTPCLAQSALQKIDVEPLPAGASSSPAGFGFSAPMPDSSQFPELAGVAYFVASTPATGTELFKTDGTALGTQLVADLSPGPADTIFGETEVMGGRLYFAADLGSGTYNLWSTDGTAGGTAVVATFGPSFFGRPEELTAVGSRLFFSAGLLSVGRELMVSDGTTLGTKLVTDIFPGTSSSSPRNLNPAPGGGGVYFQASDVTSGLEPWSSDGTAAGTFRIKDIAPGSQSGGFSRPVALGARVVFVSWSPQTGLEPFVTDGTSAGTGILADIQPGAGDSYPITLPAGVLGSELFFEAEGVGVGAELFRTDGTAAGTFLVGDSLPGPKGSRPIPLGALNGKLLLQASLAQGAADKELYRLEAGSLVLVKDLSVGLSSTPEDALVLGSKMLFRARNTFGKWALWSTDGTAAGTSQVLETAPTSSGMLPDWLTPVQGGLAVLQADTLPFGVELFVTDGTTVGTQLIGDLDPTTGPIPSSLEALVSADGERLFFTALPAGDSSRSVFQWSESGGVELLLGQKQGLLDPGGVRPSWLGDHESVLFSGTDTSGPGVFSGLYSTNGTAGGTVLLDSFGPGSLPGTSVLAGNGQLVVFAASDLVHGSEPWITNGAVGGAAFLAELVPGPGSSNPNAGVFFDGSVFFMARNGLAGEALWRTDGTAPQLVTVINSSGSASAEHMTVVGTKLYFAADDGMNGKELWVSDGTGAGTHMIVDLKPGPLPSLPKELRVFGECCTSSPEST